MARARKPTIMERLEPSVAKLCEIFNDYPTDHQWSRADDVILIEEVFAVFNEMRSVLSGDKVRRLKENKNAP